MNQNQMQQLQRARAQEIQRQRLIQQEQYRRQLAQRQRPQVQRKSGKGQVVSGLSTAATGFIVGNAIQDAYQDVNRTDLENLEGMTLERMVYPDEVIIEEDAFSVIADLGSLFM